MSKKLLLADDSVVIQKLVGLSFANEDIEIISTDNGDDAVARAREIRPDVILADVVMPGLSGYEVCEAIKQDAELSHIPVLLLTGTFEAFDETRAASTGANGQITKPFEAQALVDRVTEVMNAPVITVVADEPEVTLPPVKPPAASDVSDAIPVGPAAPPLDLESPVAGAANSGDLFDRDVNSLTGAGDDLSLDRTPNLTPGDAFPVEPDPNETTSSGLFGAPGDAAVENFDTEGGGMTLGNAVAADAPGAVDPAAETQIASTPPSFGATPSNEAAPLSPLGTSMASEPADPLADPALSEAPPEPLPAARPVDLDAALAGAPTPDTEDATILVADDDVNAETSPGHAVDLHAETAAGGSVPGVDVEHPLRRYDDLLVHVPSSDIDADRAASPTPPAPAADAPPPDETVVADLDASLEMSPDDADLAFPETPDPLAFGPASVPPDDLDFAFDVSEQVAAENAADLREDPFAPSSSAPDGADDDLSESQILGAGRLDESGRADSAPPVSAPADWRVSHEPQAIVAGYDVSSSDLATATATATGPQASGSASATPPPIPEPEHLDVLPELPQAHAPAQPDPSASASGDLFDGLSTGSPLDELATPTEFTSGSDLDPNEDLLDEDLSVEIGAPIPASPAAPMPSLESEPLVEVEPVEATTQDEIQASPAVEVLDPSESNSDFAIGTGAAAAFGASSDEDRRVPDLSPVMEQHIQETLEKVAWEAFSDLSESIVKQVMDRVEQIAWEVIPEMAETLVREEIRKMKGEED